MSSGGSRCTRLGLRSAGGRSDGPGLPTVAVKDVEAVEDHGGQGRQRNWEPMRMGSGQRATAQAEWELGPASSSSVGGGDAGR